MAAETKEIGAAKVGIFDIMGDSDKVKGFDLDFTVDESIDDFLDIYRKFPGKKFDLTFRYQH